MSLSLLLGLDIAFAFLQLVLLLDDNLELLSISLVVHDILHLDLELCSFFLLILKVAIDVGQLSLRLILDTIKVHLVVAGVESLADTHIVEG